MTSPPGSPPPVPTSYAEFRSRYVRPTAGRKVAGVCAAIARATNTDPVLWRVLFAVFALVGGAGLFAYAAAWLLMPAEGDTGSPLEALFGRGRSSTSALLTVFLMIAAFGTAAFVVSSNFRFAVLLAVLVVGILMLVGRRGAPAAEPAGFAPPAAPAGWTPAPAWAPPTPPAPAATDPTVGVTAPFAPHGPFTPTASPYPAVAWPVPPPPRPRKPPKPPKEKSVLGRLTFFAALLALGALGVADAAGGNVPVAGYFATGLGVVGLGLLVGALFGRAYTLIALGVVFALGLGAAVAAGPVRGVVRSSGSRTWIPQSVGVLEPEYSIRFGEGTLDLSRIDFTDRTATVTVRVEGGDMTVILPPSVDAEVTADVEAGEANVFGVRYDDGARSLFTDLGADGAGGGKLVIDLRVNFGTAEVRR